MRKKPIKFTPLDAVIIGVGILCVGLFIWRVEATMDYKWRWNVLVQYLLRFDADAGRWVPGLVTEGLLTTIRLAAWTMVFATLLGMIMGLARTAKGLFPRMVGRTYVELIRNTPPLVLIFIFYFFLADHLMTALGVDDFIRSSPLWFQNLLPHVAAPVPRISNFLAALLTMAVYEGAFITEHVRAGIQSIERGQHEAAYALGLTRWQQMRHVILPQAFSRIVPPLAGQFISTIKDTAIVSVISVQELTFQGLELMAATYMTFEIMITVTVLYLMLTLTCSALARKLELRLRNNL
ncbi:amino acid ABC transporter permease [Desulfovibrio ferrophilus]|uniref:Polar amino acid ABC transporter, inner membrane subunit n=1 Tax=Desulfovibrio ferrophilus TaxID=241368 RepID=A0A2Z6B0E7_9BACT|nr:amino acid ABC transporter permease [Desulfovibrio ferrophilus]BBD08928.1 Polar amino acid ABC transporter, inner membrane subunit [Desulfovibrio ferrophilus]